MKKFFLIIFIFFLNFSNIFAYEKNFKYDEIKFIKKSDFVVIIFEDKEWSFEFKGKKYSPKFGIKFLENYNWNFTKIKIDKNFLENFKKNDTKLKKLEKIF